MKTLTVTLCLTIAVLLESVGGSWDARFQKGFTTYKRGYWAPTPRGWKLLAEQGNADAQGNLGELYICSLTLQEMK